MSDNSHQPGRADISYTVDGAPPSLGSPEERGGAFGRSALAWAFFEFARNPYYLLVVVYIFAPYLARDVIAANALADGRFAHLTDAEAIRAANAHGQAFVAGITKWAGAGAALTAPILGAALDRGGKRKPLMAVILIILAICSSLLWWVMPGEGGLSLFQMSAILVIASVCYTYSEVIHNAMLSDAGRPEVLSRISGFGLALGSLAGTLLMIAIILMFAAPGEIHFPFKEPLFGIDLSSFEQFRLAGPLTAVWLAIFIWPFLLYCPDAGQKGASWLRAISEGLQGMWQTLKNARAHGEVMKFLLARLLYADGMSALLALGAVYVAGELGWSLVELAGYAIWLSVFATLGGLLGGLLDRLFGIKHALVLELCVLTIVLVFLISITQNSIFFGSVESFRIFSGNYYSHLHDLAYLVGAAFLGSFATACISSSRSMLVDLAPKHMIGEFFGLYAIAGTVTVWLGPLLVEIFTSLFTSQRVGMATIAILFISGIAMLTSIRYRPS